MKKRETLAWLAKPSLEPTSQTRVGGARELVDGALHAQGVGVERRGQAAGRWW